MIQAPESRNRVSPRIIRAGIVGLVISMILGLIIIGSELVGLGSWRILLIAAVGLAIPASGVAILAIPFRNFRLEATQVIVFSVILTLSAFVILKVSLEARDWAFARLAERSEQLIAAIKSYDAMHGRPPKTLDDLVPAHLTEVPNTGIPAYPNYEYKLFPVDAATNLYWYDLGSRNGQGFPGLWKYPDGESENSILVIVTNRTGITIEIDGDRFPESFERVKFDPDSWNGRVQRVTMVHDLVTTERPVGKPFSDIKKVLGSPDGSRILLDTDWELRVPCSLGVLNWDVFFYWPSEVYPQRLYGGSIEQIGGWAYVHE